MSLYSVLIPGALLLFIVWLIWVSGETRRGNDRSVQTIKTALEKRGMRDIIVRRLSDLSGGIVSYEAIYTDDKGAATKIACLVSAGHIFWSNAEPLSEQPLLSAERAVS
jgi:hypothetical protein